jgi:hypothetical protein
MPDIFFSSKDEAPEGLRDALTEDSSTGKFKINVVPNAKLVEFRENNINLAKERDELKSVVDTVKPLVGDDVEGFKNELSELRRTKQLVDDGKLKGSDSVQKEVETRVASMEQNYQAQLAEMGKKLQNVTEFGQNMSVKYQNSVRDREITNAVLASDSGANPEALPDILHRARELFQVQEDGTLVAKQGDTTIYGADGATPMQPNEWLGKLLEKAPYLGKSSAGGGAAGERGGEKFGGLSSAEFNKLTPQQRLALHRQGGKKR